VLAATNMMDTDNRRIGRFLFADPVALFVAAAASRDLKAANGFMRALWREAITTHQGDW
jgi:hypothetical protein